MRFMRMRALCCGLAAIFLTSGANGQMPTVTISDVQTFKPASWTANPGEAQSTFIRYAQPDGSSKARILISNDALPYGQAFVPTGTVAYEDIGGSPQSSTFQTAPGCEQPFTPPATLITVPSTCNWYYLSNDHDLISTSDGTIYYMPGVGYKGPAATAQQPFWFLSATNSNPTSRGAFGPNTRSGVAVWKSTDHGQSFQWGSFFDPANYFNGTCAFPQYRNPPRTPTGYVGPPWDMGGSDGQAAWVDPMTNRIFLTFQCVGYSPAKENPWVLLLEPGGMTASDGTNRASAPVNATILASFDGKAWTAVAMPEQMGWRTGAIPYRQYLLLGMGFNVMIADTTKPGGALQAAYPAQGGPPQVYDPWPNFQSPPFLWVANLVPNVLTHWGYNGYAFGYQTNNAAPGAPEMHGYSLYYFWLPTIEVSDYVPNPQWSETPTQINPTATGGFISDPTGIDVGSGTTLLYWYDADVTNQVVSIRGRLLLQGGSSTNDFSITPAAFNVQGGSANFWGDYKTAGGYCYNDGTSVTSVYYPMWVDVGSGTAQYAQVSTTVPWSGTTMIAPGCRQAAPTNVLGGRNNISRNPPRQLVLQLSKAQAVKPGRLVDGTTVKVRVPKPDVEDHLQRKLEVEPVVTPKAQ